MMNHPARPALGHRLARNNFVPAMRAKRPGLTVAGSKKDRFHETTLSQNMAWAARP